MIGKNIRNALLVLTAVAALGAVAYWLLRPSAPPLQPFVLGSEALKSMLDGKADLHYPSLLQHPHLDFFMANTRQVKRSADVILLADTLRERLRVLVETSKSVLLD